MLVMWAAAVTHITFNSILIIGVEEQLRGKMMALTIALSAVILPLLLCSADI